MQIKISARHGNLSDQTRSRIQAKLEKLPRLFDRLMAIEVTVDLERRDALVVDVRVSAEHKHDFVATVEAGELMAGLDAAINKLEQQLRKYKEKIQQRHRNPDSRRRPVAPEAEERGAS